MRSVKSQSAWCVRAHWTLSGVMVGLIIVFFAFGFRPAWSRQRLLRDETERAKRELETSRSRAANFLVLASEVKRLENQLLKFNKRLPRTMELPEFINEMTQASQQCNLKPVYHPQAVKKLDLYSEVPITMTFTGDFTSVFNFLRQMEGLQRLTRVKSLNLKSKDAKLGQVEASLVMNIYYSDL
jgi:Tfp pilus assembly protein PilO